MAAVSAPARAPPAAWGHAEAGTATGTSVGVPRGGGPSPPLALPANIAGQRVRGDEGDPVKLLGLFCPPPLPWQEPCFRSAKLLTFAIGAGSG